jgi:hypothetical protein
MDAHLESSRLCLTLAATIASVAAVGCKKVDPSPQGSTIFEWDIDKPRKPELEQAKVGARTPKKLSVLLRPPGEGNAVEILVSLELAPFDLVTRTEAYYLKTPASVRAEVAKNERWVVTGKCDEAGATLPNAPPPAPLYVTCKVSLAGPKQEAYGAILHFKGDGSATFDGNYDTVVLITEK